jgi:hypothetical protein
MVKIVAADTVCRTNWTLVCWDQVGDPGLKERKARKDQYPAST